jgi:hypothetical protein
MNLDRRLHRSHALHCAPNVPVSRRRSDTGHGGPVPTCHRTAETRADDLNPVTPMMAHPAPYLMNSISEYFGSGQRSSATSFSRRSATSRTSSIAGITVSRM